METAQRAFVNVIIIGPAPYVIKVIKIKEEKREEENK